ncbi:unnamed protein product [Schistosoma mattheei]|uniref:Uncharacterized protein n=1 Tax=Schistosoma mattheei TaxID=31246 RepID=A0A3P7Y479_9TREM|nr:unnamed protein product [Schistosoma mattheei]
MWGIRCLHLYLIHRLCCFLLPIFWCIFQSHISPISLQFVPFLLTWQIFWFLLAQLLVVISQYLWWFKSHLGLVNVWVTNYHILKCTQNELNFSHNIF